LPQTWTLEDDFKRVLAWLSLGIDDVLDVSVPGYKPKSHTAILLFPKERQEETGLIR